jgi:hypothetical protein
VCCPGRPDSCPSRSKRRLITYGHGAAQVVSCPSRLGPSCVASGPSAVRRRTWLITLQGWLRAIALRRSSRRHPAKSSFTVRSGPRPEDFGAISASAHGGRSQAKSSFYAIADGGPTSGSTTASSGLVLSFRAAGEAGSGRLASSVVQQRIRASNRSELLFRHRAVPTLALPRHAAFWDRSPPDPPIGPGVIVRY